jgi:glycosyltransferase involved in cell wall biosynthesis
LADERVRFVGAVDEKRMPELYGDADCVIVPSMWYETYNFVIREAASTGALVIASNIGAMPEAIREGECGFLFDACDETGLCKALERALEFDFGGYKQVSYPSVADEGKIYESIYETALKNKKELP